MSTEPSTVTQWLQQMQQGDQAAVQKLWERYFTQLVGLARSKLHGLPRAVVDEEDVALSAFHSFCQAAGKGRFPLLEDRDNLWRLLVTITAHKAFQLARSNQRLKRGGQGRHAGGPETGSPKPVVENVSFQEILGREPTADFVAQAAEEFQQLLASLPFPDLRLVAQWKMEGYTNEEIAAKLGCATRSVGRKLKTIRTVWEERGRV